MLSECIYTSGGGGGGIIVQLLSAANDTVTVNIGGSTYSFQTDENGIGNVSIPVAGTFRFYSSVAKDPSNLSNPYSKEFVITADTKTLKLMPDKALYWYGWLDLDVHVGDNNSILVTSQSYTHIAPTYNTNSLEMNPGSGSMDTYLFKVGVFGSYTKAIASGSSYSFVGSVSTLPYDFNTTSGNVTNAQISTKKVYSVAVGTYNRACYVRANYGGTMSLDAWWIE